MAGALFALGALLVACGSATDPQLAESAGTESAAAVPTTSTEPNTTTNSAVELSEAASVSSSTTSSSSTASSSSSTTQPEAIGNEADTAEVEAGSDDVDPAVETTTSTTSSSTTTTSTSTTTSTTTTTTTAAPTAGSFGAEVFEITDAIADRMEHSWREGCPVGLDELRLITLDHWNYSGDLASGELIVHVDHADDIVLVFSRLFDARFPIERMELVDNYLGDDDLSMAANNTSAFNCREIAARPGTWSNHAFGGAVDINPLMNPYVTNNGIYPPEGATFADRSVQVTGGIYPGDAVTQAFAEIGWGWGGDWNSAKDWQHFSASGR